ncbi:uncharacterized protein LOC130549070 [Triplophysa rosa]|uniref:uncharacterized protein LOC130549070 n=1 Tax=Triplophysa rosa TaxID=992332 RepID=UPI002545E98A|nr:uncharacterized protein LOC130549070 [Triplophysa rosa]
MLYRTHHKRRFSQQPIKSSQVNGMKIFILCLFSLIVNGVFGVEVKSVMEGDSVTLNTDVIKQRDDLIVWCYGPDDAVIAIINGKVGSTMYSDDERYKDRLKLNDQTGSLTINNLTTDHSGLYKLKISSNNTVSYKRFNVTVSAHLPILFISRDFSQNSSSSGRSDSPAMRIIIIPSVFALLICVVIFIIIISVCRRKRGESLMTTSPAKEPLMDEERNI